MKLYAAVLLMIIGLCQFRLWTGEGSVPHVMALDQQIAAMRLENQQLQKRNNRIISEVNDLKNGFEAMEERARFELGMLKQGEIFYRFADE